MKLGLYDIVRALTLFLHLLRPSEANQFSRRQLMLLLQPSFSEEGSNTRKYENEVFALFSKYVSEAANGRRGAITLGKILQFATEQGLMKSHLLDLNCNLAFNLFQQLKSSNGHLFLQQIHVVRLCF